LTLPYRGHSYPAPTVVLRRHGAGSGRPERPPIQGGIMHDDSTKPDRSRTRVGLKLALVGAGLAAGAIIAGAIGANAATSSTSTSTTAGTSTSAPSAPSNGRPPADRHGSHPVRSDEKSVDAALAAKLKAAALKAVSGGTVYRVETDSGDATYEAHMTKSDGTEVTVKFDKNLKVTGIEAGMGK
jgi:hypothetical protein